MGACVQRERFRTRTDSELGVQDALQRLELAARAGAVAGVQQAFHPADVGRLVGGVEQNELVPTLGGPKELSVPELQAFTRDECPLLVRVVGEQFAVVAVQRLVDPTRTHGRLERGDVDGDLIGRKERDGPAREHDAVAATERRARKVRGLVHARSRRFDVDVGPQRVEHLFSVHPVSGCEREHLDQEGRMAPRPRVGGHGTAVDLDLEPAQQADVDPHAANVRRSR